MWRRRRTNTTAKDDRFKGDNRARIYVNCGINILTDDSTPGAILIPQSTDKENDNNRSNQGGEVEENSAIKRFLQCPGMCRIEVLKKFIRNKYNVDTNQYYIDILYKRVPLPDHYTLIDIAYIYSWKRNEPMKFFFKITDIKLVSDSFDYLIQPQIRKELKSANQDSKTSKDKSKSSEKELGNTIDQNNGLEIITKIQKVSDKNGLQIGIKITKQHVKKQPQKSQKRKQSPVKEVSDVDQEKSQFLKSFQLTAKSSLPKLPKPPPRPSLPPLPPPQSAPKRKGSPIKTDRPKKPKKSPSPSKPLQNPTVQQILSNVKQNGPNLPKIAEDGNSDLQALLFDSYKINIPSSLSVTVKNEKDDPTQSPFQKPVQNYIEILKIPESPSSKPSPSKPADGKPTEKAEVKSPSKPSAGYLPTKLGSSSRDFVKLNPRTPQTFQKMFEEAIRKPEFTNKFQTIPIVKGDSGSKPNILEIASKLYKKHEKNGEVKKRPAAKKTKTPERGNPPLKDFNSYISSKSPPQQTVTGLHSPSLGLNYTVSVAQSKSSPNPLEVEIPSSSTSSKQSSPRTPNPKPETAPKHPTSPKSQPPLKKEAGTTSSIPAASKLAVNVVTSSGTENSQPLSPDKLLEKYNIQNLAQLSANFNFPQNLMNATNQLAAMQQAMIYRHFEMQNHHNWLNMNPGPLMQYEKYLKSLTKS
ncbi:polycomb group protein Psc-like [Photinus pyralis]|nr:polycomb group protein Psc-like [Photinus pyralis]